MTAPSLAALVSAAPSARKTPANHEFQHQCALFEWARNPAVVRSLPGIDLLSASLNGVHLTKAQAGKAKASGMLTGEYDVKLPVPRGPWIGYIIEMKFGKNDRTTEQQWYGKRMMEEGWKVDTFWDWEDARRAIIAYLNQPKSSLMPTF